MLLIVLELVHIRQYLRGRTELARVLVLIDSRHGAKPNDRELFDLLEPPEPTPANAISAAQGFALPHVGAYADFYRELSGGATLNVSWSGVTFFEDVTAATLAGQQLEHRDDALALDLEGEAARGLAQRAGAMDDSTHGASTAA